MPEAGAGTRRVTGAIQTGTTHHGKMTAVSADEIARAAEDLGLPEEAVDLDKVLILKDFLKFYGRAANLTGSLADADLDAHVIEGLQLVALARQLGVQGRWLDIGSGGGFPGLVLAIGLDLQLTLVEPREKRADLLTLGLRKLGRADCEVLRGRIDGGQWRGIEGGPLEPGFDACSARAVFEPERWVREGGPWLRPGGLLFTHLGAGQVAPAGLDEQGRLERGRWAIVAGVPRGTLGS
ncbi:methyltransferase GidB [Plesiocystis pacifica SIR-1]|uniref:Ribosomal RNA small subunit methyltransferase G n=2 Tax=Plesiocystis pacifica TaxID=191768 RepID=A6GJ26_9BACT|nr:methyltransferase GidB [Plesiocystis pacifica SIR-1]